MMELKLDTNALASLIDADPTFKIAIQQAVLQNITNRYIKNAGAELDLIMLNAKREMLDKYSKLDSFGRRTLTADVKNEIKTNIDSEISGLIKSSLDGIGPLINTAVADAFDKIDKTKINKSLDRLMERYTMEYIQNKLNVRWNETLKLLAQE